MMWRNDKDEAVSPVIGVILMVAITVILAAVVFVVVGNVGSDQDAAPAMSFDKDAASSSLTIIKADSNVPWSDLSVTGCTAPASGNITAGQSLTSCSGAVSVVHSPTNSLLYSTDF